MQEIINKSGSINKTSDEIPLQEILLMIKSVLNILKLKWAYIFLFALLGATIGFTYAYSKKSVYTASLTFVLEDDKSNSSGLSSALGLASSLGIDLGAGSGSNIFSGNNLIELMKSRSLVEKTLLVPVIINNRKQTLADYYIEFNKLKKAWAGKPELEKIQFGLLPDRTAFSLQQDSILGKLYERIVGQNGSGVLTVLQKDKKVSIITVEVKSENELFAKLFTESLVKVVSDYYVETKTKKAKYNFEILQKQTDSIRNELDMAISGVAQANDNTYNLNPALNIKRAISSRRQVDVQANTAILTQLVTNLEIAKVTLRKETPLIQIIDKPILPLAKENASKSTTLLIFGFLFGFLSCLFFILQQWWHKILKK